MSTAIATPVCSVRLAGKTSILFVLPSAQLGGAMTHCSLPVPDDGKGSRSMSAEEGPVGTMVGRRVAGLMGTPSRCSSFSMWRRVLKMSTERRREGSALRAGAGAELGAGDMAPGEGERSLSMEMLRMDWRWALYDESESSMSSCLRLRPP